MVIVLLVINNSSLLFEENNINKFLESFIMVKLQIYLPVQMSGVQDIAGYDGRRLDSPDFELPDLEQTYSII